MFYFFEAGLCECLPVVWAGISAEDGTDGNEKCLSDGVSVGYCYPWVQLYMSERFGSVVIEK